MLENLLFIKYAPSITKDFAVLFKFLNKPPVDVVSLNTNLRLYTMAVQWRYSHCSKSHGNCRKVSPQSTIGKIGNTYAPVAQKGGCRRCNAKGARKAPKSNECY